eukprot:5715214-Pyramimonas_sp.AAC.1
MPTGLAQMHRPTQEGWIPGGREVGKGGRERRGVDDPVFLASPLCSMCALKHVCHRGAACPTAAGNLTPPRLQMGAKSLGSIFPWAVLVDGLERAVVWSGGPVVLASLGRVRFSFARTIEEHP